MWDQVLGETRGISSRQVGWNQLLVRLETRLLTKSLSQVQHCTSAQTFVRSHFFTTPLPVKKRTRNSVCQCETRCFINVRTKAFANVLKGLLGNRKVALHFKAFHWQSQAETFSLHSLQSSFTIIEGNVCPCLNM